MQGERRLIRGRRRLERAARQEAPDPRLDLRRQILGKVPRHGVYPRKTELPSLLLEILEWTARRPENADRKLHGIEFQAWNPVTDSGPER